MHDPSQIRDDTGSGSRQDPPAGILKDSFEPLLEPYSETLLGNNLEKRTAGRRQDPRS